MAKILAIAATGSISRDYWFYNSCYFKHKSFVIIHTAVRAIICKKQYMKCKLDCFLTSNNWIKINTAVSIVDELIKLRIL